jgi:hypothetical protein
VLFFAVTVTHPFALSLSKGACQRANAAFVVRQAFDRAHAEVSPRTDNVTVIMKSSTKPLGYIGQFCCAGYTSQKSVVQCVSHSGKTVGRFCKRSSCMAHFR